MEEIKCSPNEGQWWCPSRKINDPSGPPEIWLLALSMVFFGMSTRQWLTRSCLGLMFVRYFPRHLCRHQSWTALGHSRCPRPFSVSTDFPLPPQPILTQPHSQDSGLIYPLDHSSQCWEYSSHYWYRVYHRVVWNALMLWAEIRLRHCWKRSGVVTSSLF